MGPLVRVFLAGLLVVGVVLAAPQALAPFEEHNENSRHDFSDFSGPDTGREDTLTTEAPPEDTTIPEELTAFYYNPHSSFSRPHRSNPVYVDPTHLELTHEEIIPVFYQEEPTEEPSHEVPPHDELLLFPEHDDSDAHEGTTISDHGEVAPSSAHDDSYTSEPLAEPEPTFIHEDFPHEVVSQFPEHDDPAILSDHEDDTNEYSTYDEVVNEELPFPDYEEPDPVLKSAHEEVVPFSDHEGSDPHLSHEGDA